MYNWHEDVGFHSETAQRVLSVSVSGDVRHTFRTYSKIFDVNRYLQKCGALENSYNSYIFSNMAIYILYHFFGIGIYVKFQGRLSQHEFLETYLFLQPE